ncbi:ABC transporter substrate-binding protein [Pasteurellaceae bacterium LIM206]|nr:ABC transporter substrate-binding protein [Pasteurellaceae bacterium LIM206]
MLKTLKLSTALLLATVLGSPLVTAKTVQDVRGNQIELPDQVNRIADLWPANNQIVLLLGGADKLVGTVSVVSNNPWFKEVYPNIANVPALTNGQSVQLESLLGQKPDAVLLSSPAMLKEVEQAGLKGVLASFQNFAGLKNTVRITAEVIGDNAPQIAEEYIKELEGNMAFVAERLKNVPAEQKPTVIHISNGNNLLRIDGGKSMIGEWVSFAGGKNALSDQANLVEVTMEDVIKANPDIIIIGGFGADKGIEKLKADPLWASLNAVKNGKVFVNPLGTFPWDRYSAEEALQILWAAKTFHPDLFKDVDIAAKAQAFYKKYYNYDLSTENANRMLNGLPPVQAKN